MYSGESTLSVGAFGSGADLQIPAGLTTGIFRILTHVHADNPTLRPIATAFDDSLIIQVLGHSQMTYHGMERHESESAQVFPNNAFDSTLNEHGAWIGGEQSTRNQEPVEQITAYAVARIKDHPGNTPFFLSTVYTLLAGVSWEIPEQFKNVPVTLQDQRESIDFDIAVHAEDIDIEPHWIQHHTFFRDKQSKFLEFRLTPRKTGQKEIRVEFYYQYHWLAQIKFDVAVLAAREIVPA